MRRALLTALPFLAIGVLAAAYLDSVRADKERQYLAQSTAFLSTAYAASIQTYSLATQTVYNEVVARPDILRLFAQGAAAGGAARDVARGALYRALYPAYRNLVRNNVRQFHFVLADGTSYLRMHQPDRAGDLVTDVRPSLRMAIAENRPVQGFEAGKILSGFRFAYPIAHQGVTIGGVEISVSFTAIQQAMAALDPGREYAFVVRREVVAPALFEGQHHLYTESSLHPDFWTEDPLPELYPSPPVLSAATRAADASLRADPAVRRAMTAGETFTMGTQAGGRNLAVSFVPVHDLAGRLAGYVISYAPTEMLAVFRQEFRVALIAVAVVLAATFLLVYRLLRQRSLLARQRNRLDIITQTMADGLYVLDEAGLTTFINEPGARMVGFRPDEVLGRPIHDLVHAHARSDGLPLHDCPIFQTVRSGVAYRGEELFMDKAGARFPVEVTSVPLVEHGRVTGVVTVFRDITQRKARDQERERIITALQRSHEEMSRLSEVTAHHLQEPVRRLVSFAQLLRRRLAARADGGADEGTGITFTSLEAEALHMRDLIRDVQIYLAAGQPARDETVLDPAAVANEEITQRSALLESIGARATVEPMPPVRVERRRLRRVLDVLLDNAIRFRHPERPLRVTVTARREGGRVIFRVSDNGPGIPAEFRERVFRLFERLHPESDTRGTGIGLSIVRRIVESSGGGVLIEECPGGGTCVIFDLPAAEAIEPADGAATPVTTREGAHA